MRVKAIGALTTQDAAMALPAQASSNELHSEPEDATEGEASTQVLHYIP